MQYFSSFFLPSVQSCPIVKDYLEKSQQFFGQGFLVVVAIVFCLGLRKTYHPAGLVPKVGLELMASWFLVRCLTCQTHSFLSLLKSQAILSNFLNWFSIFPRVQHIHPCLEKTRELYSTLSFCSHLWCYVLASNYHSLILSLQIMWNPLLCHLFIFPNFPFSLNDMLGHLQGIHMLIFWIPTQNV